MRRVLLSAFALACVASFSATYAGDSQCTTKCNGLCDSLPKKISMLPSFINSAVSSACKTFVCGYLTGCCTPTPDAEKPAEETK